MSFAVFATLDPAAGGLHQYSLTLLDALAAIARERGGLPCTVHASLEGATHVGEAVRERLACVLPVQRSGMLHTATEDFWRHVGGTRRRGQWRDLKQRLGRAAGRADGPPPLNPPDADWLLFTAPDERALDTPLPYVMPVHDLQHRLQPEFPEVSADGEWQRRETLFGDGIRKARMVLVDSPTGREDVIDCYGEFGVSARQVQVLPFVAPHYLRAAVAQSERARVRQAWSLPPRYLFYPAQFWPHKNHVLLVQALALLRRERGLSIPLVLCGSKSGALREQTHAGLMTLAAEGEVAGQIHDLGYVPDADMSALYAEAVALAMPTFFGPTNIPVLEAWSFSCAVISSAIRGVREQVGDAGLLVDPRAPADMASAIEQLWTDTALRERLVAAGHRRLLAWGPDEFRERVATVVDEMEAQCGPKGRGEEERHT